MHFLYTMLQTFLHMLARERAVGGGVESTAPEGHRKYDLHEMAIVWMYLAHHDVFCIS